MKKSYLALVLLLCFVMLFGLVGLVSKLDVDIDKGGVGGVSDVSTITNVPATTTKPPVTTSCVHTYSSTTGKCTKCGAECVHTFVKVNDSIHKCESCDLEAFHSSKSFSFDKDNLTSHLEVHECIFCLSRYYQAFDNCTYDNTGSGICTVCKLECGHSYEVAYNSPNNDGTHTENLKCSYCSKTKTGEIKSCVFGTNGVCSNCGYEQEQACEHLNMQVVNTATCGEDGVTYDYCPDCYYESEKWEAEATGDHDFYMGTCTVCGAPDEHYNPPSSQYCNVCQKELDECECDNGDDGGGSGEASPSICGTCESEISACVCGELLCGCNGPFHVCVACEHGVPIGTYCPYCDN